MDENSYDIIVIGAGPAGLTAAQYIARAGMTVLVLEKMVSGGQIATTDEVENYPGFVEPVSGFELGQLMEKQAKKFGAKTKSVAVTVIEKVAEELVVKTAKEGFNCKALVIASGVNPSKLGVPGEDKFQGRGVSYCATCDGAFYKDKEIAVVGGGDSAVEEALFLTKFVAKVHLIHRRDRFRAINVLQEKAKANEKIEIHFNNIVKEIEGEKKVSAIAIEDVKSGEARKIAVEGVFFYVGNNPNVDFLADLELDKNMGGYLITTEAMATNVLGVFAAGDVRQKPLRQVVTATGDGAIAAMEAIKYIDENF